ncbi:DUF6789 family protein [Halomicroarcula sp. GCM10025709]|uniref:DUF6789 family protein n=1 Tax=Haloarcula TaxID=2237 RepID=UPI0024C2E64C|nr:DUF6789 family protein [Halomicroarcula sp. YJ-61-S]
MDPVRSGLAGGAAATGVLLLFLLTVDLALGGTNLFVLTTFASLCTIGGPPYCQLGSVTATLLTGIVFLSLFVVAWPLLFTGFTWGLPGESGAVHGVMFGAVIWLGYAATVWIAVFRGWEELSATLPILAAMLLAYLVYGLVLGGVYDRLAAHRTLMSTEA